MAMKWLMFYTGSFFGGSLSAYFDLIEQKVYFAESKFGLGLSADELKGLVPSIQEDIIQKRSLSDCECEHFCSVVDSLQITAWESRYINRHILDGNQWEVTLSLADVAPIKIHGLNAYPENWTVLEELVKHLLA